MGVEQVTTYTCDPGGEQSTDAAGWMIFTLTASPISMVDPNPAPIAFGSQQWVVCPNHISEVESAIGLALAEITAPTPEPMAAAAAPVKRSAKKAAAKRTARR